jgi:putative Mg2+ transporter-C (MgtC) family protein
MELEILLKILLSAILGGIIGLEREISHKGAGLRTNILIAIGSTLLTILSFKFAILGKNVDPSRIAAQIVTGIGFLGAGAIIQARFSIHGLTTAASIWTVSAIGISVGSGYYLISFLITIFVIIILTFFKYISKIIEKQKNMFVYIIKTEDRASIFIEIKKVITELGINYINADFYKYKGEIEIEILFSSSQNKNEKFLDKVLQLKGVNKITSEKL